LGRKRTKHNRAARKGGAKCKKTTALTEDTETTWGNFKDGKDRIKTAVVEKDRGPRGKFTLARDTKSSVTKPDKKKGVNGDGGREGTL